MTPSRIWDKAPYRFTLLFVPVALAVVAAIAIIYQLEVKNEIELLLVDQNAKVRLEKAHMEQLLADGIADVRIQALSLNLINLPLRPTETDLKAIESDFINLLRLKKIYSQAKFINWLGQEVVRVDYAKGETSLIPWERLQDKSDRYYFTETMKLADGQVFVSPFDLNVENGEVQRPLNPTIRLASPVVDSQGNKRGMVILNYMGGVLLEGLRNRFGDVGTPMLVDENGWWLLGARPEDEWGFMLAERKGRKFPSDFPEGWRYILKNSQGSVFTKQGLLTFDSISAPGVGTTPPRWYIISFLSSDRVDKRLGVYLRELAWLAAGLLAGLAVLVYFLVRAHGARLRYRQMVVENEARLRVILDTAADGIITLDPKGIIRSLNPAAERIFGYQSAELIGKSAQVLFHPSRRDAAELYMKHLLTDNQPDLGQTIETIGLTKNGDPVPLNISASLAWLKSGPLMIGVVRDISRRKQAEARLTQNAENQTVLKELMSLALQSGELEDALSEALEIIYSTSWLQALPKGGFFLAESEGDGQSLRLSASRGLESRITEMCGRVPIGRCHCGQAAATGEIQFSDHVDNRHDNTYPGMPGHGHYCVPITSDERVLGVLLLYVPEGHRSSQDELVFLESVGRTMAALIERRSALNAIAESEARLRAVLENAVEGIVTIDERGIVESANQTMEQVFGYAPEEILGRNISIIQPEPVRSNHDKYIRRYLETGESRIIGIGREVEGLKKDGTRFPLYLSVSEVRQGGRITFTGILRDITELKEYQAALMLAKEQAEAANQKLMEKQRLLDEDLEAAAGIQKALLPDKLPDLKQVKLAWRFKPSQSIGGDLFHATLLSKDHLSLYMFDVTGHGVPSALLTVSVHEQLDPKNGHVVEPDPNGGTSIIPPGKVMDFLDAEYPLERFAKSFTINYMVLTLSTGELRYSSAGHPPPLLIRADGALERLEEGGTIIGLGGVLPFEEGRAFLRPGDKLLLYTDGVLEYEDQDDAFFGAQRLEQTLVKHHAKSIEAILNQIWTELEGFSGGRPPSDDVSMLGLEFNG